MHQKSLISLTWFHLISLGILTQNLPHDFISMVQNLTKLQKLHLRGISIPSVFPNPLLHWSSLISLDLLDGALHGRFPDHDIHLPKLEVLSLEGNINLSGNFPRFSENNSLWSCIYHPKISVESFRLQLAI